MDWDRVEGNWRQFKGQAKERWGRLTEDELTQVAGNRDLLMGRIQAKYGLAEDEARRQIDQWLSRTQDAAEDFFGWLKRSAQEQPGVTFGATMALAFILGAIWKR